MTDFQLTTVHGAIHLQKIISLIRLLIQTVFVIVCMTVIVIAIV